MSLDVIRLLIAIILLPENEKNVKRLYTPKAQGLRGRAVYIQNRNMSLILSYFNFQYYYSGTHRIIRSTVPHNV